MQIVEALTDSNVLDIDGNTIYALRGGVRYAIYDAEASRGMQAGAVTAIANLDRVVPSYEGETLDRQRLILPFIGRLGDAIVAGSCLTALLDRFPNVTIDIAAPAPARAVFELMPNVGRILAYPLEAEAIEDYDFHLSFEDVDAVPRGTSRSCADVFSACLRTPLPTNPPLITVPPEVAERWTMPQADRPRVALHIGRPDNPRTYPVDLMAALAKELVADGFDVVLLGANGAGGCPASLNIPQVENLIGSTKTPADLAAVLSQMSALITGDSFPMHLAGAMGVPTLAIFTATDRVFVTDYPSVTAIQSTAECSPCRIATGSCPLGHNECIAHRDASIDPRAIVDRVHAMCCELATHEV